MIRYVWDHASALRIDLTSLSAIAGSVLLAAYILLSFLGTGFCLLQLWHERLDGVWRPFFAFALGFIAAEFSLFALGFIPKGYSGFSLNAALLLLGGFGMWGLWIERDLLRRIRFLRPPLWGLFGVALYAIWHAGILAISPPAEWDVIAYHLAIPKLYLAAERLYDIPWLLHSHWPHALELIYLFPLHLGLDRVAAIIHLGISLTLVAAVGTAAWHELKSPMAATLSVTLLLIHPLFLRFSGTAHADASVSLLVFLSLIAIWKSASSESHSGWGLAGILIGGAITTKLTAGVYAAALLLMIVLYPRWRRHTLSFLLPAIFVVSPWLIKATWWSGNPIWPFGARWWGGSHGAEGVEKAFFSVATMTEWPAQGGWTEFQMIYVVVPALLLIVLVLWRVRNFPPLLSFILWIQLPLALFLHNHVSFWRFLWPAIPAYTLATAWSAAALMKLSPRWKVLVVSLLMVTAYPLARSAMGFQLLPILGFRSLSAPTVNPRDAYLTKTVNVYAASEFLNQTLQPGEKVLLYKEIRGYYLNVPYQWGDPVNQGIVNYAEYSSPSQLSEALEVSGITHVLVNEGHYSYPEKMESLMASVLTTHASILWQEGPVRVYGLSQHLR